MERYSFEKAREKADRMREKIEIGQASSYDEAELIVAAEDMNNEAILSGNSKVELSEEKLAENWIAFEKNFLETVEQNEILKRNYERNIEAAEEFVSTLPLIHSFRNSDKEVISGIGTYGGIFSRGYAEEKEIQIRQIIDSGFDKLVGIDSHVSAFVANKGSSIYGEHAFVIDPELVKEKNNFFVMAGDTARFRDMFFQNDIADSILPGIELKKFLQNYVAAFYERPDQYITQNYVETQSYLSRIGASNKHLSVNSDVNSAYSPEVRIYQSIPTESIIGYMKVGEEDSVVKSQLRNYLPNVKEVTYDPDIAFGENARRCFLERK